MSDQSRVQDYKVKLGELQQERQEWESLWEECTRFVLPSRDMWGKDENAAGHEVKKGKDIYDSRPVSNLQTLANGMVGYNAGPSSPWYRLKMASEELNDIAFVMDWLEDCEKRMYIIFSSTNFYDELTEFYLDMGDVGNGTMIVEEHHQKGIVYSTRHPKESYYLEGPDGRVDSLYRDVWLTGRQAIERYGNALKPETSRLFKDKITEKHLFLHVIHPRYDRDVYSDLNINMPYASVEMYAPDDAILRETGYNEFPGACGRWRKNSNETYGRSPTMDALSDIKRANQIKKTMMDAAHLSVKPPKNVPKEMARKLNMMPDGINVYKDPARVVTPIDMGRGYPFARDVLDGIHEDIEEHFFTDLFKMLSRAQREMTAREVAERQGERVTGLSGPLTRQNSEVLRPLVKRTFSIAMRNGWLMPPPPALLETGIPIDVEFIGLLAMAQKQYYRANGLNRGVQFIAGIAEASQDMSVWDNVNLDDLARQSMNSEGFPQTSIEEKPIVEQKRKARAAAIQQQQQIDQAEQVAGMVPNLSKAPEPGSPGEAMADQVSKALPAGRA